MVTTGYVKKAIGLTERAIRYYCDLNLITPKKNEIGHINLSNEDLLDLIKVLTLKILGRRLKSIASFPLHELDIREIRLQLDEMYTHIEYLLLSLNQLENVENENVILNTLKLSYEFNEKYINKR
ncbi:MerR family transcriptional regulator [Bacillus pseudomycoides]|uniref:MerR family transcriptional regulator n=1 Tax=Bacillus bingmayongensis TaxID=1150157 RepID=A0ABU5K5V9_9BACI|nr:MerR family transcriptional regulator [Bacillus pseudomycoides]